MREVADQQELQDVGRYRLEATYTVWARAASELYRLYLSGCSPHAAAHAWSGSICSQPVEFVVSECGAAS